MMMKYDGKSAIVLVLLAFFLSQTGCSLKSLQMTKEEIQRLENTEGIIFGSILVEAKDPENDSGWQTFWKGKKASDFKYSFLLKKVDDNSGAYEIIVDPNNEKTFVSKLVGGDYRIYKIWVVYVSDYLYTDTDVRFTVLPQKATYVGRLRVSFPERVKMFSKFGLEIEDDQAVAESQAKKEFGLNESIITKGLMQIQKD